MFIDITHYAKYERQDRTQNRPDHQHTQPA